MSDEIALGNNEQDDEFKRDTGVRYEKKGPNYGLLTQDIYSVKDLALVIGVHPTTILEQIKSNKLKALNIGGPAGYRIYRDNIIAWIKNERHE
jgi:excisionase family DNA binding protein